MREDNFIEDILREAEEKEHQDIYSYMDLLLIEIKVNQLQIEKNFNTANKEIEIINNWALNKNSKLQERIELLEKKLELFIKEDGVKTIDLPNGTIKMHKKPDKIEITDLDEFLGNATSELVSKQPEIIKPELNKIKAYFKRTRKIPAGCKLIEGKEEFSYKLKTEELNGRKEKVGTGVKQADELKAVV